MHVQEKLHGLEELLTEINEAGQRVLVLLNTVSWAIFI
ncbi:MAG: hypothetical protein CM15mP49_36390 [Actinomycetota bacterium]|nr:MAG: hypothetical protein CM15mP49_36390 [Actinomycetota bacterium]